MKTLYLKVADGKIIGIEKYPNFSADGSIKGMKDQFYGKDALLVRCGSWIYNVPENIYNIAYRRSMLLKSDRY